MRKLFFTYAAFFLLWVGVLAVPFHYLFQTVPDAVGEHPVAHDEESGFGPGSLGSERRAVLMEATRHYVAEHPEAPAAMAAGREFAPPEWLNHEIEQQQAHWRVRSVNGLHVKIYDVS